MQTVGEDVCGDPEVFCEFLGAACPGCVFAEGFYGDESPRSLDSYKVLDAGPLAAVVATLNMYELVGEGAAAFVLLETGVERAALEAHHVVAALVAGGQTIIYSMHQSIGHLGIFVSASVANKEHEEFTAAMDMIDIMPPGLYEAVFLEKDEEMLQEELAAGDMMGGD